MAEQYIKKSDALNIIKECGANYVAAWVNIQNYKPADVAQVTCCRNCNHWAQFASCKALGRCLGRNVGLTTKATDFCSWASEKDGDV